MASLGGEKKKEIKRKPHRFQKPFWLLKVRRGKKKKEKELFQSKQVTVLGQCHVEKEFKYLIVIPINRKTHNHSYLLK